MKDNWFALKTLHYIWTHPNSRDQKIQSIVRFFGWQFYKRLIHRNLILQLLPNVKYYCYTGSAASSAAFYCGLYEYDEMNFLLRYLRPEDSFLDVGANVGIYTLLAASKIHSGLIYSFEAFPKNHKRLQKNLKLNQFEQVKTYAIAVSDHTGSVFLNLADRDSTLSITSLETEQKISVPTDTLDNLLHAEPTKNLTLAKMDIEGAEILALKGALSLLQQKRPPSGSSNSMRR